MPANVSHKRFSDTYKTAPNSLEALLAKRDELRNRISEIVDGLPLNKKEDFQFQAGVREHRGILHAKGLEKEDDLLAKYPEADTLDYQKAVEENPILGEVAQFNSGKVVKFNNIEKEILKDQLHIKEVIIDPMPTVPEEIIIDPESSLKLDDPVLEPAVTHLKVDEINPGSEVLLNNVYPERMQARLLETQEEKEVTSSKPEFSFEDLTNILNPEMTLQELNTNADDLAMQAEAMAKAAEQMVGELENSAASLIEEPLITPFAQAAEEFAPGAKTRTMSEGMTLAKLAKEEYGNEEAWIEIYLANQDQIEGAVMNNSTADVNQIEYDENIFMGLELVIKKEAPVKANSFAMAA